MFSQIDSELLCLIPPCKAFLELPTNNQKCKCCVFPHCCSSYLFNSDTGYEISTPSVKSLPVKDSPWVLFLCVHVICVFLIKADSQWYHGAQSDLRVPPHPGPVFSQHPAHHCVPRLPGGHWKPAERTRLHEGQHPGQQQHPLQGMSWLLCPFTFLAVKAQPHIHRELDKESRGWVSRSRTFQQTGVTLCIWNFSLMMLPPYQQAPLYG